MAGRYVVLGLASARSTWFRNVGQWSHSAAVPIEFVKCVSAAEVRAHLASGRAFSALLVDGGVPSLDRDLVDDVHTGSCAVVVVDDVRVSRDWASIGVDAVINPVFERKDLLDILTATARPIVRGEVLPGELSLPQPPQVASVAMVCGSGGTGASTVAVALAQGLADRADDGVLLADLSLRAEQAMLHDVAEVSPTIQEIADAHRNGRPTVDDMRGWTFHVLERGYRLGLGLRRSRQWTAIRPRAFQATFDSFCRAFSYVVCDVDSDVESESDGGSIDVEERNVMARTCAERASVAVVVGTPGLKGTHSLVRTILDLADHGVGGERILPVVNMAPKSPRARQEITSAIGQLVAPHLVSEMLATPVFLPEKNVDACFRDGVRLPAGLTAPLTAAFDAVLERGGTTAARAEPEPLRIGKGSIGSWTAELR